MQHPVKDRLCSRGQELGLVDVARIGFASLAVLFLSGLASGTVPVVRFGVQTVTEHLIEGRDISFRRLPNTAALSQTRVAHMVEDSDGFLWFGTQYGLNRYDGYRSKVFKHEPGHADSLSCVYIRSLFVDHSGALWVGCDRFLDKFEPITETFAHYRISTDIPGGVPTPIEQINEDHTGILWLATARGLYKLDPATRQTTRYIHDPANPTSISGNRVNFAGEDRTGRFWIASSGGLDEFDRKTGKVIWHVPFQSDIAEFHEDKSRRLLGDHQLLSILRGGDAEFNG